MNRLALLLASLCAAACSHPPAAPPEPRHDLTEELHLLPYPGDPPWKEISRGWKPGPMLMIEWIPSDQAVPDVRDVLTVQVVHSLRGMEPTQFVRGMMSLTAKACERTKVNGPKEQTEEGYAVAYAQIYCARQKSADKDVDILLKAIRGNDALYVIQREFRRPATPGAEPGTRIFHERALAEQAANAMASANRYLVDGVALCPLSGASAHCDALKQAESK